MKYEDGLLQLILPRKGKKPAGKQIPVKYVTVPPISSSVTRLAGLFYKILSDKNRNACFVKLKRFRIAI
jgi:hypothetical protein